MGRSAVCREAAWHAQVSRVARREHWIRSPWRREPGLKDGGAPMGRQLRLVHGCHCRLSQIKNPPGSEAFWAHSLTNAPSTSARYRCRPECTQRGSKTLIPVCRGRLALKRSCIDVQGRTAPGISDNSHLLLGHLLALPIPSLHDHLAKLRRLCLPPLGALAGGPSFCFHGADRPDVELGAVAFPLLLCHSPRLLRLDPRGDLHGPRGEARRQVGRHVVVHVLELHLTLRLGGGGRARHPEPRQRRHLEGGDGRLAQRAILGDARLRRHARASAWRPSARDGRRPRRLGRGHHGHGRGGLAPHRELHRRALLLVRQDPVHLLERRHRLACDLEDDVADLPAPLGSLGVDAHHQALLELQAERPGQR
mmetsp:Transcript_33261/g.95043  ORF Transcript_33261/g.95043 Transcript_33261/m.95043 type:complete len:366 (+) Transcript_33261:62-1159(+)